MIWGAIAPVKAFGLLLSTLAALALAVAGLGVHGVVRHAAEQRSREMGVRMALGAPLPRLGLSIALDGLRSVMYGAVLGLGLGLLAVRLARSFLEGVSVLDPGVVGVVVLALAAVATAAMASPVLRVLGRAPGEVLRTT